MQKSLTAWSESVHYGDKRTITWVRLRMVVVVVVVSCSKVFGLRDGWAAGEGRERDWTRGEGGMFMLYVFDLSYEMKIKIPIIIIIHLRIYARLLN